MSEVVLQARDLGKRFRTREGEVAAVQGVTFGISRGEFVALYGPSGCGKSTLLLMCGALLSPDGGTVEIAGQNPYRLRPERRAGFRADHLGFVFQQFHLIPYLTVLENVLAGELAGAGGSRERAGELLARFQLGHRLGHKPSELSVGEQQRVALARALARAPKVLLADEPTGNLDGENAAIILDHLAAFAREGGAVLMVTHDEAARGRAQRSLALREGRLSV